MPRSKRRPWTLGRRSGRRLLERRRRLASRLRQLASQPAAPEIQGGKQQEHRPDVADRRDTGGTQAGEQSTERAGAPDLTEVFLRGVRVESLTSNQPEPRCQHRAESGDQKIQCPRSQLWCGRRQNPFRQ